MSHPTPTSSDELPAYEPKRLPPLAVELLLYLAVLAIGALVVAVASALLFAGLMDSPRAPWYLTVLILADVAIFVVFGHWLLRRVVLHPIAQTLLATEAIAAGALARRVPPGSTVEMDALSRGINRMTDNLLAHQAQIVRAEKLASVGRLAAGVAHEIGNPLGAIHGYVHVLRGRLTGDPGAAQPLAGLEHETERIDRIVRGLLDYARPRRMTPLAVDLNDTIIAVSQLLTNQGVLRRIETRMELEPATPHVFAERHELEQVFVNLMLNAADAMSGQGQIAISTHRVQTETLRSAAVRRDSDPNGFHFERGPSARAEAWLRGEHRPPWVAKVIVSDSGPGVADEDVERIFDPFYTTKEPGRGTGLGLAIVSRIVENLHGTIWVERAREGGAAFHLVLPLHETAPRPDRLAHAAAGGVAGAHA